MMNWRSTIWGWGWGFDWCALSADHKALHPTSSNINHFHRFFQLINGYSFLCFKCFFHAFIPTSAKISFSSPIWEIRKWVMFMAKEKTSIFFPFAFCMQRKFPFFEKEKSWSTLQWLLLFGQHSNEKKVQIFQLQATLTRKVHQLINCFRAKT